MDAKSQFHVASVVLMATMTAARAQAGNDELSSFPGYLTIIPPSSTYNKLPMTLSEDYRRISIPAK